MKEMILLGAGASVETGIPDAVGMTQKMLELFGDDRAHSKHNHILRFVVGGLLFQKGGRGENPFDGVNIEDVFNAIQTLADRQNLEAAPFMGSWHPLVEELDVLEPILPFYLSSKIASQSYAPSSHEIDRAIEDVINGKKGATSVGNIISKAIKSTQPRRSPFRSFLRQEEPKERTGEGKIFNRTNDIMIRKLVDLVWVNDAGKVAHLQPLLKTKSTSDRVLVTLNYDNALELAGESVGIPVETGISEMSKTGRFPVTVNGVCLLKLHGSIDWAWKDVAVSATNPLRSEVIQTVAQESMRKEGYRPAVVFGHRNKLTAHGPFLSLLEEFRSRLNNSDLLTVIGYSFRDNHINEYLTQWINERPERRIRIINGEHFKPLNRGFAHDLVQLKSRVEVLPVNASTGILNCYGLESR